MVKPLIPHVRHGMNKLEERYAFELEMRKRRGEIAGWWYEALTLKLGYDCRYTPDFLVLMADGEVQLHEVKGPHRREDAMVKIRVCATMYPFKLFMNGEEVTGG